MITKILLCALSFSAPLNEIEDTTHIHADGTVCTDCHAQEDPEKAAAEAAFWAKRKTYRLGYEFHTWKNAAGISTPVKFALGFSNVKNAWLHKEPIAGIMKFSFDRGIDLNYSMFDMDAPSYSQSEYVGEDSSESSDSSEEGEEEMGFDLASIGSHYLSVGYALGASLTINPVAKLRLNGYVHFVPSVALQLAGNSLNLGFMPYLRYGGEVSYNWFGVGVEWTSGMSNMTDMVTKLMSEVSEEGNAAVPKTKFHSDYMRVYIAFKLGKPKKKKNR